MANGKESNPATAPAAAPAGQPAQVQAKLTYVDRGDCQEIFADTVTRISFDGQTLRMELGVTRLDDVKQGDQPTGRLLPAVRVVLPPAAAVDLMNRMQQIAAALTQSGYLKKS